MGACFTHGTGGTTVRQPSSLRQHQKVPDDWFEVSRPMKRLDPSLPDVTWRLRFVVGIRRFCSLEGYGATLVGRRLRVVGTSKPRVA